MRAVYLNNRHDNGGCRGGVGDRYYDSNDYELEIGANCYASPQMISLCVHYDEIMEALGYGGPLAELLLKSISAETERLNEGLNQ